MQRIFELFIVAALGVLLAGVLPLAAHAQSEPGPPLDLEFGPAEPEPPPGFVERTTESGNYRLAKRSIPLHELVRGLLPETGHIMAVHRTLFLESSLGIKEGSPEERALLAATLAAAEVEPDSAEMARREQELIALRTREGAEVSRLRNREMMLEDARRIGVVWGRLVADLGAGSSAMVKVSAYVEKRRNGMSIVSSESFEDPNHIVWRMERAFQAGVSSVLSNDN